MPNYADKQQEVILYRLYNKGYSRSELALMFRLLPEQVEEILHRFFDQEKD